jgi:hypothetical protein
VVTDPRVDRDQQGLKPMFRRRHVAGVVKVNRFSQAVTGAREMREPPHVARFGTVSGP